MKCLVLGGGGTVGIALLYLLKKLGWTACVVDPQKPKHFSTHDKRLRETLLEWTEEAYTLSQLDERLRIEPFDTAVDLAPTLDKPECLSICDRRGVSLINATIAEFGKSVPSAARGFITHRPPMNRRPHIVAAGMNPGALNALAEEIIQTNDRPAEIIYWEYDDTIPADGLFQEPSITWCPSESAQEIDTDPAFEVLKKGKIRLYDSPLEFQPQDYRSCGAPLDQLRVSPDSDAFLIGHEECVYMGWRHNTACKFIYGFHPENMSLMRQASGKLEVKLLRQAKNHPLSGGDMVGVSCRYENHWRGAYCQLDNTPATPLDTNSTSILVASGIAASMITLKNEHVAPGVHLTHEIENYTEAFRSLIPVHNYEMSDRSLEESSYLKNGTNFTVEKKE